MYFVFFFAIDIEIYSFGTQTDLEQTDFPTSPTVFILMYTNVLCLDKLSTKTHHTFGNGNHLNQHSSLACFSLHSAPDLSCSRVKSCERFIKIGRIMNQLLLTTLWRISRLQKPLHYFRSIDIAISSGQDVLVAGASSRTPLHHVDLGQRWSLSHQILEQSSCLSISVGAYF